MRVFCESFVLVYIMGYDIKIYFLLGFVFKKIKEVGNFV